MRTSRSPSIDGGSSGTFESRILIDPAAESGPPLDDAVRPLVGARRAGADGDRAVTRPTPGIVVVDKPAGITSHDVVGRCRRIFGTRKVGHAGTLDPMATGVLVVGIERATKILGLLSGDRQVVRRHHPARSGHRPPMTPKAKCCRRFRPADVTDAQIAEAVAALRGDIEQMPSAVSAIKVDGERAYKLAREGQAVELAARRVRIDRFDVLAIRRRRRHSSMSTSRSTARRAPTSARWPATSAPRSASVAI